MEYHSRHYIVTHPADDRKTEKRECKDKLPINNKNRKFLGIITHFHTKYINRLYTSSESFNGVWVNNTNVDHVMLSDRDIIQIGCFVLRYAE